jgi:hypothetical protein|nr:MAG TPA: Repressor protein CI [Caudoviricetes sp.]
MKSKIIFGQMIDYFRNENSLTMEELGRRLGKNKSSISRWISGERYPKIEEIEEIAKYFNTDVETLIFGFNTKINDITSIYNQLTTTRQERVYNYAEEQLNEQNGQIHEDNIVPIVFGRQSAAGSMIHVDDSDAEMGVLPSSVVPSGANELVQITGDSMEPLIKKGSEVYLRYQPTVEDGEIAIVRVEDEGVTCKYLFRDGENIVLKSENSKYDDIVVDAEKVSVIGKVLI